MPLKIYQLMKSESKAFESWRKNFDSVRSMVRGNQCLLISPRNRPKRVAQNESAMSALWEFTTTDSLVESIQSSWIESSQSWDNPSGSQVKVNSESSWTPVKSSQSQASGWSQVGVKSYTGSQVSSDSKCQVRIKLGLTVKSESSAKSKSTIKSQPTLQS